MRLLSKSNRLNLAILKKQKMFEQTNFLTCVLLGTIITLIFCISCNFNERSKDEFFLNSMDFQTDLESNQNIESIKPAISNTFAEVIIGNKNFFAEIADSPKERQEGLSNRDFLEPFHGMLFVFPDNGAGAFWMKGMRFPLDFIWIGNDCKVVDLTENVVVDTNQEELRIYNSSQPAEFNFEVNAGEVQLSNIQIGDIVQFKNIDVEGISCDQR
ncbi:MAG: hypothetical protein CL735_05865 [Chloroflexi bacterium]|nr:hypothetical protein [Chloroflexota bacterium]